MLLGKLREKLAQLILGNRFDSNFAFTMKEAKKSAVHHHEAYIERLVRSSNNGSLCHPRIHVIHLIVTNNVGDIHCGPEYYLKKSGIDAEIIIHDLEAIDETAIRKEDVVIIGGGGLIDFSDDWNVAINRCIALSDNVVIWGAGYNSHYANRKITVPIDMDRIKLIGIRDDIAKDIYVPCVSCMLSHFDWNYTVKRRIGVVKHKDFSGNIPGELLQYDSVTNTAGLESIVRFIGESEYIVTNTYHAYYWATLLKKKVVLFGAFSTKFENLRYPPVRYSANLEEDLKKTVVYENALEESRQINRAYLNTIRNSMLPLSEKQEDGGESFDGNNAKESFDI